MSYHHEWNITPPPPGTFCVTIHTRYRPSMPYIAAKRHTLAVAAVSRYYLLAFNKCSDGEGDMSGGNTLSCSCC